MVIFGWLCLLAITVYAVCATALYAYASLMLGTKVGWGILAPAGISLGLAYATWLNFPFTISVQ